MSREVTGDEKPLTKVAEAFRELATFIDSGAGAVDVAAFSHACTLVTPLFVCLGPILRLAENEYVSKVNSIVEASKTFKTLPNLVEADIQTNTVERMGSYTRNLLRVKRALEMLKILFREMLITESDSMTGPTLTAYTEAFGGYHRSYAQNIIAFALPAIGSKSQLIRKVNETEASARSQMQIYITASEKVIEYVVHLYDSRELGTDW